MRRLIRSEGREERGQILPLFAIVVTGMLVMAALVFDGASALVLRRQSQDAADAAALAAASVMADTGCSVSTGGTPYGYLTQAARSSASANLPGLDPSNVAVSCPSDWPNTAIKVTISQNAPGYFGGVVGRGGTPVAASAIGINGRQPGLNIQYAAILLQPYSPTNGSKSCPALKITGNPFKPSLILDGDMIVNSTCPASAGGAVNIGSGDVTGLNGSVLRAAGDVVVRHEERGDPPIASGQPASIDPLAGVPEPDITKLTLRSSTLYTPARNEVLKPGIYRGGLKVQATTLLEPGIYYLDGGGMQVTGGGKLFSVNRGVTTTSAATWATDCTPSACGVLIFNNPGASAGQIFVRGEVYLRAYSHAAAGGTYAPSAYNNIGLWQAGSSSTQPRIDIGGATVFEMIGALYAPNATFRVWGTSDPAVFYDYAISSQIIANDMEIGGNATATLKKTIGFSSAPAIDFGLVE